MGSSRMVVLSSAGGGSGANFGDDPLARNARDQASCLVGIHGAPRLLVLACAVPGGDARNQRVVGSRMEALERALVDPTRRNQLVDASDIVLDGLDDAAQIADRKR